MNSKTLFPLLLLLLWGSTLLAQPKISVKSFERKENDMTARIDAPKKDQNGDFCAIIKVVTLQTGFIWEPDGLGIVSADYKTGEYWLYVPYGAKRLTIKHDKLGILRDYMYPVPIEKSVVYIMELTTGKVTTTVEPEQIASQWLVVNTDPTGTDIFIDDQPANQTPYQSELPIGKHTYRLSRDLYLPTAGVVDLTADKKETITVTMKPDFGTLKITSSPESGATVSIDGLPTGKVTPCTIEQVKSGERTVTLRLNMYKMATEKIAMQAGGNLNLPVTLAPTFAGVTVTTNPSSDIYIAGERKGNGTWEGRLLPGIYNFEARKEKYTSATDKREVVSGQPLTINLQPVAKTGTLKVMTTPTDATITLGGANKGTAPATLRDLLVGDYTLSLSLPGYATTTKTVTIAEGETAQVTETLVNGRAVTVASEPSGAALSIDGNPVGQTPYNGSLTFGSHTLQIQQGDKKAEKTVSISQSGGETSFSLSFGPQSFTETVNGAAIEMVAIKGGTFRMGSNEGDDEKPIHSVTVSDFSIGKTEVTQAQWTAIMSSNPSNFKGDNLPVEMVTWDDVQVFLGKLNTKTGKTYRLPTEAEWEYAAGGGENSRTKYAGTDSESSLGNYSWYGDNSGNKTHPVGTKQPNQLGLYDMSGNVWEWCSDWYGGNYYSSSPQNNPKGASTGSDRVLRGVSWYSTASRCRVSYRYSYYPAARSYYFGFRLVRSF
jgi:formylglycine-generating enzyme required for sulfatase activity